MRFRSVVWLAGLTGLSLLAASARAQTPELAPYRAVYELAIDDSAGEVAPSASVNGRMAVEFTGSRCSGYKSKMRIVTEGEDSDGNAQVTDARTESLETDKGRFEFNNQTYVNDALAEESAGVATRRGDGVVVALTKPDKKRVLARRRGGVSHRADTEGPG